MIDVTMIPFSAFRFAQGQARRRKALSEVMPVGGEFTYFVLLSDAYLGIGDGERYIGSFDDLRKALSSGDDLKALLAARANGQLTEGRHQLPDVVVEHLGLAGSGLAHVRRWGFGGSEPIIATIAVSEINDALTESNFEEIEVGDLSGNWYIRTREDEPLIFVAVVAGPLLEQLRLCKEFCCEVTGDFEYAH